MPISEKDREFMEQVTAYFRSTKTHQEPAGSIRDTASKFDISRNKVRKILITLRELESPITVDVIRMRKQGLSIKEIAKQLGVSVATVSTALPYENKVDNSLDPTAHASDVRAYRAYERERLRRQAGGSSIKAGVPKVKEAAIMADQRTNELGVIRLHMELYDEYSDQVIDDDTAAVFRKYGGVEYGRSISRDVIIPRDIPLYALHYVIQRAFGWQNSHLHQFELPEKRFETLTNQKALTWSRLVGVLFRSPFMDEEDEFWADDYNGGSFKNWLRKKYTGPYMSQCNGEGILSCRIDMMQLDMEADYYVMYARTFNRDSRKYDGEEYVSDVSPVFDYHGKKRPAPKPWFSDDMPYRVEVVRFEGVPSTGLRFLFERNPMALLERLPIDSVLAAGKNRIPVNVYDEEDGYIREQITASGDEIYLKRDRLIERILIEQIDSPDRQVLPMPVTDVILYNYDFGDDWKIRITASENCSDLLLSGRVTRAELDRAIAKCREIHRPVLIARDGEMLVDDAGGIRGFADFLRRINPELQGMDPEEIEEAKREKKAHLDWAKSIGWNRENPSNINLL